jgi:aspartyl-tRNA(Asn)/glutamyl-tRNA(Gln) amidotransferase subunit A
MCIISAPDSRDVYGWVSPSPDFCAGLEDGVRGLRIAYSPRLGFAVHVDPEVEQAVSAAARRFVDLGAIVEEADPGIGSDAIDAWNTLWWSAMALQLAPFADRLATDADPGLVATSKHGPEIRAFELIRAQMLRAELHNRMAQFHDTHDLLLTPALPLPAFEVGDLVPKSGQWGKEWTDWAPFSYPFNLTQQPAACVPCGLTTSGLPIAVQIVGPVGADAAVLRASRAFEASRAFPLTDAPRKR